LDTPKLRTELARFRKVLSEGLVPKDVRGKIKELMDGIADQLKNQGQRNVTRFRHANANALLSGLGLDAETTRILRQRLAQIGAGGTVPGSRSAAFAGAGANNVVVQTTVNLDGKKVAQNTTKHQRRATQRRSESRRGPYAGRH
jgi:dihydroorotate dehydrogenase